MLVRGAPLIGVTAAYGVAVSLLSGHKKNDLEMICSSLLETRPTAVNLFWALEEMKKALLSTNDNDILEILSKRMIISNKIGKPKKKQNVAVLQSKRWNEILGKMILEGKEKGLSEDFVLKIFKAIHQESINHQEKIINA